MKHWHIAPPAPTEYIETLKGQGIHSVVAQILYHRGYTTVSEAVAFFTHYDGDDNPFRLKGMIEAVYRLRMAIRRNEKIAVYGDFDADGVTSSVLLTQVLRKLGAEVQPYIPDRVGEGYGLNSPALEALASQGVKVVVTVDCGIRSVPEAADAASYGLDMIISDHHSVGPVIPGVTAVINPKQENCPYPEKMLAGVGLAYKIAQGLYMEAQRRGYRAEGWHPDDWLDLVAIGTVADIAPLRGENRMLVERGLLRLNRPQRTGLQAIYNVAGITPGQVTAMTIGFQIGPRINAAGRLKSAMLAFDLLDATDAAQANQLAHELNTLNRTRQEKTMEMQNWAEEHIPGNPGDEPLLFAADPRFEQGVVGLVASRLTEQYYRPSVVIQMGKHESHGSCRSIPEFHITHALEECDPLLLRYGGHAAAAGFTISNDNIEELQERLWDIAAEYLGEHENLLPTLQVDAEIHLEEATIELVEALDKLEPTGEANPQPLFVIRNLTIVNMQQVGKEAQHLKLQLTDGGKASAQAIAFRWGDMMDHLPRQIDAAGHLEFNEWNGRRSLQFNIQDIHASSQ